MMTEVTLAKARIAGAILAGGQAVRYGGKPKGLLEAVTGRSIIEEEIRQLNLAGIDEIIIVGNALEPYRHCRLPIIPDLRPDIGPLAGIEAALAHYALSYDATLFLPCDLPGITAAEICRLKAAFVNSSAPVAVAITEHCFWEPLCAVVHNALLATVSQAIDAGQRRPRRVWRDVGALTVDFDDAGPFFNVNTPEDLTRWRAMRGKLDERHIGRAAGHAGASGELRHGRRYSG